MNMPDKQFRLHKITLIVLVLLAFHAPALADGKFFPPRETVPPGLPYQRAVIAHDGNKELMILQSKFEGEAKEFGWVVPLPAVPEFASMDAARCDSMFNSLSDNTRPSEQSIYKILVMVVFLISMGLLVYSLALKASRKAGETKQPKFFTARKAGSIAVVLFAALIAVSLLTGRGCSLLDPFFPFFGVDILKVESVGIYDVQVISSPDGGELVQWLRQQGYAFDNTDESTFDEYAKQGWCFVVTRVDLRKIKKEGFGSGEGLVNPLVMVFESKELVYPLALTGTIGSEVVVLLYIFDSHKVADNSERFTLRYAGHHEIESFVQHTYFEQEGFGKHWNFTQSYLTKLKATLTPEQMKEDLILKQAPNDTPYRERIYRR